MYLHVRDEPGKQRDRPGPTRPQLAQVLARGSGRHRDRPRDRPRPLQVQEVTSVVGSPSLTIL